LNWFLCWRYGHIAPGDGCCDLATRIFGPIHIGSIHLDPPFLKDYSYWIDLQKIAISPSFFWFLLSLEEMSSLLSDVKKQSEVRFLARRVSWWFTRFDVRMKPTKSLHLSHK
jgi:hypothetical protein